MTIDFDITKTYKRLKDNWSNRYIIAYGGSSSSKSVSILQLLTLYALRNDNKRVTISAESLPVLKKTVIPDWKDIVMQELYNDKLFNKSEMTYTFPTGTVFQFVPADDATRWHGMRQDITYFDELFHIKKAIYDQADIRTKDKIISSFNPAAMFWIADQFYDKNTYVDHSTYKDNPYLEKPIIDALEKRIKTDQNFYDVYVLGKWGSLKGVIFEENKHWAVCDELPETYKKRIIGLDFGYSNDPAAIVDIRYANGEIWIKELNYKTEQLNSDLAEILLPLECKVVADSAEPKSIAELQKLRVNIYPAQKGKDSINNGIQLIKEYKVNVTSDSLNVIKELRNYKWDENRQGETLTKPIDNWNHCFVGDTQISMITGTKNIKDVKVGDAVLTSKGYNRVNKVFNNGVKQIATYSLQFDTFSLSLQCTSTHKVKTTNGWKEIAQLKQGDAIYLRRNLITKLITNIKENGISQKDVGDCIQTYGSTTTGLSLKGIISTIRTATLKIILLVILNLWGLVIILQWRESADIRRILNGVDHSMRKVYRQLKHGIRQKRGYNGTQNMEKEHGIKENTEPSYVRCVEKNLKQDTQESPNIATIIVNLKHLEIEEKQQEEVYDLEINGVHEYFANGVLVHNCIDSIRYGMFSMFNEKNVFFM